VCAYLQRKKKQLALQSLVDGDFVIRQGAGACWGRGGGGEEARVIRTLLMGHTHANVCTNS
jgi:hypothetical protein